MYLFVLVGRNGNKGGFVKCVRVEAVPPHGEDVVRLHNVNSWLILVH